VVGNKSNFKLKSICIETCVLLKASGSMITFLELYVDDIILLFGNDIPTLEGAKA
jgi:hypothetical protein